MTGAAELRVGDHYARVRSRVASTFAQLDDPSLDTPVPACPGWQVRDVLGHLVGVVEDATAGRLSGPPDEAMTAEQVARHRGDSVEAMLESWQQLAPRFEPVISDMQAWPAAIDVFSHECDVLHALSRPAPRDDALVAVLAPMLAARLAGHAEVILDGAPCPTTPPSPVQLRVTPFEFVRVAMGRRSLDQIAALDWTGDATAAISRLCVFGPATEPIVE